MNIKFNVSRDREFVLVQLILHFIYNHNTALLTSNLKRKDVTLAPVSYSIGTKCTNLKARIIKLKILL